MNIPFAQVCFIQIKVDTDDRKTVTLVTGDLEMDTERELAKYFVVEESPSFIKVDSHEIRMKLVLKRPFTSATMTAFIPSLLLICCSYVTSFFRLPNFFNAAIAANLTVLLTMRTLISDVSKGIAETSYIKWLEFWLLFCTFVPFVQVILITIIEWLRNQEDMEEKKNKEESRKEIGLERSTELYEMSVGGRNVKVGHPSPQLSLFFCLQAGSPSCDTDNTEG